MALLLSVVAPAVAQQSSVATDGNVTRAASPGQGPTDPTELEAFLDDLFARQMAEYSIAGAAISVVKDGQLYLAKGYGYADVANGIPVDPEQTLFRVGSVGKLFTWTAVMQLAEQGKLDLDADINTYLDFRIPDTYPQPITLKHLLTHTAGFEDRYFEYLAWDADSLMPPSEWLASHMPARVRPPGDFAAYSNYGTQLAGYIVARVSGQPYEQYVQKHILDPLGMTYSTAQSPIPPDLRAHMAEGYMYVDGAFQPVPEFFGQSAMFPAGAHAISAADMARFMIAHLADGRENNTGTDGVRILTESTVQQMHDTLYAPDPRLMGTAYGLFDLSDNGRRTLGHDGDTLGFKALLLLLPDEHLGVFVAYNGEEAGDLTRQHFGFQRAFFDHYYPAAAVEPVQSPANFAERAGRFEGSYRTTRNAYTTLEKYRSMTDGVEVSNPGDGALLVQTPWGEWRFVEVEPLYFRQVDAPFAMLFREDDQGRITHMSIDAVPQFAFEKMKWYETPGFTMGLILVCILMFLSVIPVAAVRFIRNRRQSADKEPAPRGARVAHWIILAICVLNLLFVAGTVLWGEANLTPLFGVSPIYRAVLGLGVLSAVLTVGALIYTVLAWKDSYWSVAGRVYYTLVTVAAVAFVGFLDFWNLLGWRF
jgi:CubicO group peptidase (beta-lactamase class C family)